MINYIIIVTNITQAIKNMKKKVLDITSFDCPMTFIKAKEFIKSNTDNQKIIIDLEETSSNLLISVKDEGPGFAETSPQKIFKRFYSNRPTSFGKHSGLGLNIVKNIIQLHKGTIAASNRLNTKGAQVEVLLPKLS